MRTRVLLTGASGFVGSHVLEHLLVNTDWDVVCPVTMRHMGTWDRLSRAVDRPGLEGTHDRVTTLVHDLATPFSASEIGVMQARGPIDVFMNVASESHVDRSINDPVPFVRNNSDMMLNMLELARRITPQVFLQMSTDEVYGPAERGHAHAEWETPYPSNPYSASKAAQEAYAFAWWRTYGVPVIITNTMNIFGETQDAEKFFAKVMKAVASSNQITVHGQQSPSYLRTDEAGGRYVESGGWTIGSRFWLHARNLADAWLWLAKRALEHGVERYADTPATMPTKLHIVGEREINNLELAEIIADAMGRPLHYVMEDFHSSRPGHDLRYALDGTKLSSLGWKPPVSVEEGIARTVRWTLEHPEWL